MLETHPDGVRVEAFRFPGGVLIGPNKGFSRIHRLVSSGTVEPGQPVMSLPSGQWTTVAEIDQHQQQPQEAGASQLRGPHYLRAHRSWVAVTCSWTARSSGLSNSHVVNLIWLSARLHCGTISAIFIKHTTKTVVARVTRLNRCADVDAFEERWADTLQFNEIGQAEFELYTPIFS